MRRSVGLAIGAVVLSITVGVLVGLVIHTGMTQRAGDSSATTPPVVTSSQPVSTLVEDSSAPLGDDPADAASPGSSAPWLRSLNPVTDGSAAGQAGSTTTETVTESPGTPTTATSSSTRAAPSTGSTSPSTTPSTRPARLSPTTGATSATVIHTTVPMGSTTPNSVTDPPGHDSPDGPCGTLGQKSSTPDGATLFCQHDQSNGSLRWRAVTEGGGCLNRTMTGIGLDGKQYACRRSGNGLNYWRPAS